MCFSRLYYTFARNKSLDNSILINKSALMLLVQYANDNNDVDIMIIGIHTNRHCSFVNYQLLFSSSFLFTIHFVRTNKHNKFKEKSCAYHLTNNLESSIGKQLESTK